MMRSIVGWALRYRGLVLGLAAVGLLFGFLQLPRMPRDVLPEFSPPYVEVQTEALGLSADEVEQLITVPLEADLLQGVAFLDEIHSQSVPGLSSIVMFFEPGTDLFHARQVVAERLTQAHALPNVSKAPLMLQPLSSSSRVLMVSLSSAEVSHIDLSVLARWNIRPRLLGVPGVANVAIWGQRERQMQVLVDPERMRERGVSLQHIIETTGNALWVSPLTFLDASTPGAGGFIDTPNQRLSVQHTFPIQTPEELAQVPIAPEDTGGRIVRLGDVADIVEDHQLLIGDALVNDGPGLMLVIEKFPNADTLAVTRAVEEAFEAMKPGLGGIAIDTTVFRPATYVEEAVGNVSLALLIGFALVALVLFVFFRDWRSALVAVATIPLSFVAALLVLNALGATINAIVVAGLIVAVGVLVDDAIAGTAALARRLRQPRDGDSDRSFGMIVVGAMLEARSPLTYATVIVVLALVPLFLVATGTAAAFLPPFVIAYAVAIVASAIVALTVAPALASVLRVGSGGRASETDAARRLGRQYESMLARLLRRSGPLLAGVAIVTVAAIALTGVLTASQAGRSLVAPFRERDLVIHADAAPGTSRAEINRVVARAGTELRAIPGVRSVGAHVGRAVTSDQVVNVDSGEFWVSIDPAADYDRTVAAVEAVIAGYPGLGHVVATYSSERAEEILSGPAEDVTVRVYGQDLAILRGKAEEVRQALAGVDGLADVAVETQVDQPTLQIEVDLAAAARHGIKPGDIRRIAAAQLSGIVVGSLFEDQKVFEVVVWGQPELRGSLSSIREMPIQSPGGGYIALGDVADVRIAPAPAVIRREGVFRRVDVSAMVRGRDLDAVMRDVQARVDAVAFPLEYRAEVLPLAVERRSAMVGTLAVSLAAAVGIFLLLQAAFGSWRRALLVLVAFPAALVGAILAALATGGVATLAAIGGFLAVLAFTTRTTIGAIDRMARLERATEGRFGPDVVVRAAREGFAPLVTSAVATALALVPFVVLGDRAGFEIVRPMAIVILCGLLTSTLLTLFVIPALYLRSGPSPEPEAAAQLIDQPGLSPA